MNSMGAKNLEMPVRKRRKKMGKITVYPDAAVAKLYKDGQDNGWDTVAIARNAVTKALLEHRETLLQKAPEETE